MRFVIQRVKHADVKVEDRTIGEIGQGLLVFVGISASDREETADKMLKKLLGLRIFEDENGKINRSIRDVGGEILLVSQFTLYADCSHGNRPGFTEAAEPGKAKELYEYMIEQCRREIPVVEQGIFGADMKVELLNDGPFTIILE